MAIDWGLIGTTTALWGIDKILGDGSSSSGGGGGGSSSASSRQSSAQELALQQGQLAQSRADAA